MVLLALCQMCDLYCYRYIAGVVRVIGVVVVGVVGVDICIKSSVGVGIVVVG